VYGRKSTTGFSNIVYNDGAKLTNPKKARWACESVRAMFNSITAAADAIKATTAQHSVDAAIKRAKDAIADADAAITEAEERKSNAEFYLKHVAGKTDDEIYLSVVSARSAKNLPSDHISPPHAEVYNQFADINDA
jgi:methionine synthase II (cobalamin-independent)